MITMDHDQLHDTSLDRHGHGCAERGMPLAGSLITVVCVALGSLCGPAAPGADEGGRPPLSGRVGTLSDPIHWRFTGCTTVPSADIVAAIRWDLQVACAMGTDEPRARFLSVLADRLRLGYQHSGFPAAQVSLVDHQDTLDIQVVEGPRYRCGSIVYVGGTQQRSLARWLAKQAPSTSTQAPIDQEHARGVSAGAAADEHAAHATWTPGDGAPFDACSLDELRKSVIAFYVANCFEGTVCHVHIEPRQDGTASLVVEIPDDGHRPALGRLLIEGAPAGMEGAVRDLLRIPPDAQVGPPLLDSLREQLRHSGRFYDSTVEAIGSAPAQRDIRIVLKPLRASVTPLGTELSADEALAVRCAQAIERWGRGQDARDLQLRLQTAGQGTIELLVSPATRGFSCLFEPDDPGRRLGAAISASRIALFAPHARWSHAVSPSLLTTLHISLAPSAEYIEGSADAAHQSPGTFTFNISMASSSSGGFSFDIVVDPALGCLLLHSPRYTISHRGTDLDLELNKSGTVMVIPGGEEYPLPAVVPSTPTGLQVRFVPGAHAPNPEPAGEDLSASEDWGHFLAVRLIPELLRMRGLSRQAAVLTDLAQAACRHLPSASTLYQRLGFDQATDFVLPDDDGGSSSAPDLSRSIILLAYQMASSAYAADAWPTLACHDIFSSANGHGDNLPTTLERLSGNPSVGPLRCLLLACIAKYLGFAEVSRHCASAGLARQGTAAFTADVLALLPEPDACEAILGDIRRPEEAIELLLCHADDATEQALRSCHGGTHAGHRLLLAFCQTAWTEGLRERVHSGLVGLAGLDPGNF